MWQVDSGEGQFAGASGLITSNFSVSDTGDVVDHHFGLLFRPRMRSDGDIGSGHVLD